MKVLHSGIYPNKKLSQHFLIQPSIAARIVDQMGIQTGDVILEIGPGEGILTEFLLKSRAEKIIGIEIDTRLILWLKERFYGIRRFQLIEGDFLKFDLSTIASERKRIRVVGNLPYKITSSILFHILSFKEKIQDITVMVQKEVGDRIMSELGSKKYGIPSIIFQYFYEIRKLFSIHRKSFFPAPKVDSIVIQLKFRDKVLYKLEDLDYFIRIVKTSFNQRRKMLKNSLKSFFNDERILQEINYLNKRPEDLSVREFVDLSNHLFYFNERGKRG